MKGFRTKSHKLAYNNNRIWTNINILLLINLSNIIFYNFSQKIILESFNSENLDANNNFQRFYYNIRFYLGKTIQIPIQGGWVNKLDFCFTYVFYGRSLTIPAPIKVIPHKNHPQKQEFHLIFHLISGPSKSNKENFPLKRKSLHNSICYNGST